MPLLVAHTPTCTYLSNTLSGTGPTTNAARKPNVMLPFLAPQLPLLLLFLLPFHHINHHPLLPQPGFIPKGIPSVHTEVYDKTHQVKISWWPRRDVQLVSWSHTYQQLQQLQEADHPPCHSRCTSPTPSPSFF